MADLVKVENVADDDDDDDEFFDNEDDDEIFETMDDSPMQIEPGLFIGSFMAEQNKPKLLKAGITHVLQVAEGMSPSHPADFRYAMVAVQDHAAEDLAAHFPRAFAFIDEAIGHLYPPGPDGVARLAGTSTTTGHAAAAAATASGAAVADGREDGSSSTTSAVSASSTPSSSASTPAIPVPGVRSDRSDARPDGESDQAGSSGAGSNDAAAAAGPRPAAEPGPGVVDAQRAQPSSNAGAIDARPKAGVLVHCVAGVSRSATVCIGWLMWKHHLTYDQAFRKVHAVRPWVMPNIGFRHQLKAFEDNGWDTAKWVAWRHRHPEEASAVVSLAGMNIQSRPPTTASILAASGGRLTATVNDENGRRFRKSQDDCGLGTSF